MVNDKELGIFYNVGYIVEDGLFKNVAYRIVNDTDILCYFIEDRKTEIRQYDDLAYLNDDGIPFSSKTLLVNDWNFEYHCGFTGHSVYSWVGLRN